jgi:predicted nucleic acid-binding protein
MIISNATPLIAYQRIGELELLREVVGKIVIPQAVADEISRYGADKPGYIDLSKEPWIGVRSLKSDRQVRLLLPILDQGEAEVIALALEKKARLVLIDELTGRQIAESLGLSLTGSVGILIQAKRSGRIRAIKPYLNETIRQGIRYSQRFIDKVLQNVGE